ncbi:uncharacterized protein F5891DRAFT_977640 [Suillus fuscotomentosus]|uniref:Uncharacterized protein n=1 Tax=Suillus fuscotomentosus TaxID=1912939 RepID=A0AAD4EC32_9AGAM|nr:uncharacterized protein F5891DRAFT_977640 [Suillus fuscotomentosus]KAG1903520.1 hypothetical protein F5891DRAFT_977640 [Suillus fuscotomentosus]
MYIKKERVSLHLLLLLTLVIEIGTIPWQQYLCQPHTGLNFKMPTIKMVTQCTSKTGIKCRPQVISWLSNRERWPTSFPTCFGLFAVLFFGISSPSRGSEEFAVDRGTERVASLWYQMQNVNIDATSTRNCPIY